MLDSTIFGEGNGTPLQYSCLENSMDGRAWWATVHGVMKSRTRLSNFTTTSTIFSSHSSGQSQDYIINPANVILPLFKPPVVMYLLGLDIYIYNIAPALKTSWYHYFYIITGKIGSREDLHLFKLLVNGVLFLQSGMLWAYLTKQQLMKYENEWWSWSSKSLITWCKELTHWKRPWCWERLKAGGEGGNRGWDGWMASPTQWTWICTSSGSWCRTGKLGMLQSMGLQGIRHDWVTELTGNKFK